MKVLGVNIELIENVLNIYSRILDALKSISIESVDIITLKNDPEMKEIKTFICTCENLQHEVKYVKEVESKEKIVR